MSKTIRISDRAYEFLVQSATGKRQTLMAHVDELVGVPVVTVREITGGSYAPGQSIPVGPPAHISEDEMPSVLRKTLTRPQGEPAGFVTPLCDTCDHPEAAHKNGGRCQFGTGCQRSCRKYVPKTKEIF